MIDWDEVEYRAQPNADDIKAAVTQVQKMPGAGDQQHVAALFKIAGVAIPATQPGVWDNADLKTIKMKKLRATNAQLDRDNLIWHLKHPGQSKMRTKYNTHPQIIKTKDGDYLIVDGHHRLSALRLLGIKQEQVWLLKEKDM